MAFTLGQTTSTTNDDSGNGGGDFDYDGLHQHMIDAAGTQDKARNLTAIISGYNDCGLQERKNYETPYKDSDDRMKESLEKGEAELITKNFYDSEKSTWLNDCVVFSKPLPPRQAITFTVMFPQITVDTEPFFGRDSNPRPLQLIMGGEFFAVKLDGSGKKEPIIQDLTFIQENTGNPSGEWGFGTTTRLHKMASAAGLLNEHGLFTKDKLGLLLGQSFQFHIRLWNKPAKKDPNKSWYTEDLKFLSSVPEGMPLPEFDENDIHGFNLFPAVDGVMPEGKSNDPATIKMLHKRIINTVSRAKNFEGSVLEKELKELRGNTSSGGAKDQSNGSSGESNTNTPKPTKKAEDTRQGVPQKTPEVEEPDIDFDQDVPF